MSANIYVGNLAFSTDSSDLERLFAEHGPVTKAQVISDRDTGRSRGSVSSKWDRPRAPRMRSVRSTDLTMKAAASKSTSPKSVPDPFDYTALAGR